MTPASRRAALVEAIRRLEAGEVDGIASRVADAVNGWNKWPGNTKKCPPFTTSLDAAVTLVPKGMHWEASDDGCGWVMNNMKTKRWQGHPDARGPAAALCLAALRARLATIDSGGPDPT